jgi:hypothetical protein
LLAFAGGGVAAAEEPSAVVRGDVFARNFALADELGGKTGGATAFGGRATKDQGVAAILDDGLGFGMTIGAGDLMD